MPDGPELLALALELEADAVGVDAAVTTLVEAAGSSLTSLMSAHAYARSLAQDRPYDASTLHMVDLLSRALKRAKRLYEEQPRPDPTSLFQHIIDISGSAAVSPDAVASRTAEVDADVEHLRPHDDALRSLRA